MYYYKRPLKLRDFFHVGRRMNDDLCDYLTRGLRSKTDIYEAILNNFDELYVRTSGAYFHCCRLTYDALLAIYFQNRITINRDASYQNKNKMSRFYKRFVKSFRVQRLSTLNFYWLVEFTAFWLTAFSPHFLSCSLLSSCTCFSWVVLTSLSYLSEEVSILDLAREANVPPYTFARLFLQEYFKTEFGEVPPERMLYGSLPEGCGPLSSAKLTYHQVTQYLKNPVRLGNERLAQGVAECIVADELCSPLGDVIKQYAVDLCPQSNSDHSSTGLEYELVLHEKLMNLNIVFNSEADLRKAHYHKTPDVLLKVRLFYAHLSRNQQATLTAIGAN